MHHIEIPAIRYHADIPSNISECSKDQFLDFLSYYLRYASGEITYDHFRIGLVNCFIHFREPLKAIRPKDKENVLAEIYRLSELMDSFTTLQEVDGVPTRRVETHFIKNMIPVIRVGDVVLYGPSDALTDLTFMEYVDAHSLYVEYLNTQDEETLNRLVATLYRPERPDFARVRTNPAFDGQRRVKYNPSAIEQWLPVVRTKSLLVKYGIFLFFSGCEHFLHEGEIPLGSHTVKFSDLYTDSAKKSDNTGLYGLLFTLAESQVFGNVKETADANLFDVMVRLYQLVNQQKQSSTSIPADL